MPSPRAGQIQPHLIPLALLAGLVLVIFLQALSFDFTNLDDNRYVPENPALQHGLTGQSLGWAFTTSHENLWMPVTWLSFLLDAQLYGISPRGFHATNVVLHLLNTVLLYFLLWRIPGTASRARWAPLWVAALFAVHPLHVESVAWVAERKDVLSGLFFLLTLHLYVRGGSSPGRPLFWAALAVFALALMSKPMVVTLPVVLLLLDYLGRNGEPSRDKSWGRLALEKIPFFAVAVTVSAITYHLVQIRDQGAPVAVPLLERLGQALTYYALYLVKAVAPVSLAAIYPPASVRFGLPVQLACLAALALLTWGAWALRHRARPVPAGWLWFLVMLAPVLDVVQGGMQVMSDRYFYLPSIGLFLALAWLAATVAETRGEGPAWLKQAWLRPAGLAAAVAMVAVFTVMAHAQARVWRDSETLYRHALAVTQGNDKAHGNLGSFLGDQGRYAEALPHLQAAVDLHGGEALYCFNLANTLVQLGRFAEAVPHFRQAVRLQPEFPEAHNNLGIALGRIGQWEEAGRHFALATRQDPGYAAAWYNLGLVQMQAGQGAQAVHSFRQCLRHDPGHQGAARELARLTSGGNSSQPQE